MAITLYTHRATPATMINAPVYVDHDGDWYIVNARSARRISAPLPDQIDRISERMIPVTDAKVSALLAHF